MAPQLSGWEASGKPLTSLDPISPPLRGGCGASLATEQQETFIEWLARVTCCTVQSSGPGLNGRILHQGFQVAGEEQGCGGRCHGAWRWSLCPTRPLGSGATLSIAVSTSQGRACKTRPRVWTSLAGRGAGTAAPQSFCTGQGTVLSLPASGVKDLRAAE